MMIIDTISGCIKSNIYSLKKDISIFSNNNVNYIFESHLIN